MCLGRGGGGGSWSNTELHYEDEGKRKQTNRKTKGLPVDLVFNLTATHVNLWGVCSYFKSTICTPSLSLLILET